MYVNGISILSQIQNGFTLAKVGDASPNPNVIIFFLVCLNDEQWPQTVWDYSMWDTRAKTTFHGIFLRLHPQAK